MYGQSMSDYDFALLESIRRHLLDDSDLPPTFLALNSGNAPLHCRSEEVVIKDALGDAVNDFWNALNQMPLPEYEAGVGFTVGWEGVGVKD
ncbi:hypothetical protein L1049_017856 [Liquidambar formosana]|uniref:Uncharacterized protein n=1 Tax=Liquidambar formosana TaxID=63359 RepID=A0AAP0NMR3_LIQFO